ncbi:MAG TPA: TerB family tellurite resistance protein [Lentimicrobium sp.]|nr:TerB family tellurite resistance protein [Lentimicrobium sp.]
MDTNILYTEIGRMAYAIAKSNGEVKEKEIEHVFNFIDEEIKSSGTTEVMYLGAEFNKLRKMNASARDAFGMFFSFLENHGNNIQQRIKNMCIRLAIHIAATDESVDETEIAIINKLRKKLELSS